MLNISTITLESEFPTKKEIKLTLLIQDLTNKILNYTSTSLPEMAKMLRGTGVRFYVTDTETGELGYHYCEKCGKLISLEGESVQIFNDQYLHTPCPKDQVSETTKFK